MFKCVRRIRLAITAGAAITSTTALAVTIGLSGNASAASQRALTGTRAVPPWLKMAESHALHSFFGGRLTHTYYIWYPHKVAVIFEFNRVVVCGGCSAPSNAMLPRGRAIRLTYDRRSRRAGNMIQFCETRHGLPPRSNCLRR